MGEREHGRQRGRTVTPWVGGAIAALPVCTGHSPAFLLISRGPPPPFSFFIGSYDLELCLEFGAVKGRAASLALGPIPPA